MSASANGKKVFWENFLHRLQKKIGCHNGETFSKIWEQTIEEMGKNGKPLFLEKEDRENSFL